MDQCLFSAPHGLSQSITSFIASCCQGIHQTPFSRLIRSRESKALSVSEAYFPRAARAGDALVSVLDLDSLASCPEGPMTAHCRHQRDD